MFMHVKFSNCSLFFIKGAHITNYYMLPLKGNGSSPNPANERRW